MKKLILSLALATAVFAVEMPKSVIHVINVRFKAEAAKADIDDAIAAIKTVAQEYPAIKRVWLKPITVQGGASKFTHVLVMEFESEDALKKYSGSAAQKKWYEKWLKVRDLSNTHDVTN